MKTPALLTTLALFSLAVSVFAEDWPRFRGPTGQGISTETGLPTEWDEKKNVVWKVEIAGEAWSSPIVSGGRVFLTTATDGGAACRVLSLDEKTGKVLWDKEVFQQVPKHKERKNSYATPTPVTDGKVVVAVFGDGSFAALDFEGKLLWTNRDVKFYSQHGLGASPIMYGDLVIMPFDGSSETGDKSVGWQKPWDKAFILALDKATGTERWRARRGSSRIAHATPLIVQHEGRDLLPSNAGDVVQGFDPKTGELLWTVPAQGEGVVPSLSHGDGMIFSSSGFEKSTTRGIKLGAEPKIVWEETRGVPKQPSFIYASPLLFSMSDAGVIVCQQGATGEILWQERVSGAYSASPVLAEGRIYWLSETGETVIIKAAPEFELVARNPLNERTQASMAVANGRLFIRTERHLYCIQ